MSESLEIASQSLAAVLATWLGLTVVSRAPTQRGARVFGWVSLLVLVWSAAILVQRTGTDADVAVVANAIEDVAAFLLPAAVLHVVLAFTIEGPYARWQKAVLIVAYAISALMALQQVVDPSHPVALLPPRFEPPLVSGFALAALWLGFRVAILALAIILTVRAYRRAGADRVRRGQALAALATVVLASVGGTLRFLPREIAGPAWIGDAFITIALLLATYAVLGQGVFLSRRAVRSAFRSSLVGGIALAAYIGVLVGLESLAEGALGTRMPFVLATGLVATVALFDPVRNRLQPVLRGRRERAGSRVDRAIGARAVVQPPESGIQPAVERLARFLGFDRALVVSSDGATLARLGATTTETPDLVAKPLVSDGQTVGEARFGRRLDGRPYTAADDAILDDASAFIATSLTVGARRNAQAVELESLAFDHAALSRRGAELQQTLVAGADLQSLTVFALGPMRVERGGRPITSWGGPKAGSRQAEAIFAFLFDRGDRGATKDEVVEVVWPDADLERGDLAFHRTLSGLRSLLEPRRPRRGASEAVSFHHDRYHLNRALVAWSDVEEFNQLIASAGAAEDEADAIRLMARARGLYRGDYLDDCPLYGESAYVEESRVALRGRLVDLLVALGERHETRGDAMAAASAYREAITAAGGECRRAVDGLDRLGIAA
jgi:DNA-binding SARP family transcriptional activator